MTVHEPSLNLLGCSKASLRALFARTPGGGIGGQEPIVVDACPPDAAAAAAAAALVARPSPPRPVTAAAAAAAAAVAELWRLSPCAEAAALHDAAMGLRQLSPSASTGGSETMATHDGEADIDGEDEASEDVDDGQEDGEEEEEDKGEEKEGDGDEGDDDSLYGGDDDTAAYLPSTCQHTFDDLGSQPLDNGVSQGFDFNDLLGSAVPVPTAFQVCAAGAAAAAAAAAAVATAARDAAAKEIVGQETTRLELNLNSKP
jgi:hypothetical protein